MTLNRLLHEIHDLNQKIFLLKSMFVQNKEDEVFRMIIMNFLNSRRKITAGKLNFLEVGIYSNLRSL
jgi:hypothetical protein